MRWIQAAHCPPCPDSLASVRKNNIINNNIQNANYLILISFMIYCGKESGSEMLVNKKKKPSYDSMMSYISSSYTAIS